MHKWLYPVYVDVFQVLHVYQVLGHTGKSGGAYPLPWLPALTTWALHYQHLSSILHDSCIYPNYIVKVHVSFNTHWLWRQT
jgi:hypothetical protein